MSNVDGNNKDKDKDKLFGDEESSKEIYAELRQRVEEFYSSDFNAAVPFVPHHNVDVWPPIRCSEKDSKYCLYC
jgi:hypothetical protein